MKTLHVTIGPGKFSSKLLRRTVGKKIDKRAKKGQVTREKKVYESGGVYYQIYGNDYYVEKVHADLTDFFEKCTDKNVMKKAFEKAAKQSPGKVSQWMKQGEENAHERLKRIMETLFNIQFWITDSES